ncbi:MAG: RNA polymerase factor sigma-32 [Bdellovibrionales bacterium]|nr:RNA polymerase factor sigma-32 [Bdellovibrionales bacterium]
MAKKTSLKKKIATVKKKASVKKNKSSSKTVVKKTSKKKTSTKVLKKSSLTPKAKLVHAEIVDNDEPIFKDINSDNSEEELSPLEVAAKNAEQSYQGDSDDFEPDDPELSEPEERSDSSKSLVVKSPGALTTSDPLLLYLNEIRRYPLLTKEQEKEIAKKYFETKDPESAQLLVRSNLRFVVKIAAEYSKFGAKLIDLIQEGNVGLMHAVREYNPYKGARLITYAVWWIRGYIQEYLMRQYSLVRIGTTQNQRKLFYQLQREKANLDSLGNEPNLSDIAKKLDIPEDEVRIMAQRMSGRDISLDRPIDVDSPTSLNDFQKSANEENIDDFIAKEELIGILQEKVSELEPHLSDREKIILKERLLNDEPLTLQEIGERYGITREAVRQMEARLLKKIKEKMGNLT